MKQIKILFLLFFLGIFTPICWAQNTLLENKIQKADEYWKKNQRQQAMDQYKKILSEETIPDEYQSLVYLRLAKTQFQMNLTEDCRKTLNQAKNLRVLSDHHKLMIDEMEKKLKGISLTGHTSIPPKAKAVASFYVSQLTAGNKSNHGRTTLKSIEQALEKARALLRKPNLAKGSIEIIIEGETYFMDQTIKLNSHISGTKNNPIVIRSSSPDKKVLINCGKDLRHWSREIDPEVLARLPENSRSKVWVADLKENKIFGIDSLVFGGFSSRRAEGGNAVFKTFPVPELFDEGIPQKMARWPNDKDTLIALSNFKDRRVLRWASDKDVWLHGYWYYLWADAYEKVKSVSLKDTTIELAPPFNRYGFGKSKWHVVNALSELDVPGEWCISINEGKIWYFPHNDACPENCTLSQSGPAFQVDSCDYLTIQNIDFRNIRGDGMSFVNCSHLTLVNCGVKNASGLGLRIIGGNFHLLHSCSIESMGRGGIHINAGDLNTLISSGSIIENCKISNLSRIDRTYTPAILLEGVGLKVRNCLFSDIPSSAIRLEGNNMLIEMNEFTKCVIESDDQGAIDVWGNPLYRGNIIRWNFFHDIGIPNLHMAAGVRLDDAICGFGIYENLFLRSSNNQFGGIQIHGGKDNYVEGNIFVDCHAAISQTAWGEGEWKNALNRKDSPMYNAMHTCNWQSDLWQTRYPALKHLLTDSDRNYAIDNQVINAKALILRKSEKFQCLDNQLFINDSVVKKAVDYRSFLQPWHLIPFDRIGLYQF